MTREKPDWTPAWADVIWEWRDEVSERLDGEHWPNEVVLRAWQRNNDGERRIIAIQRYVRAEK